LLLLLDVGVKAGLRSGFLILGTLEVSHPYSEYRKRRENRFALLFSGKPHSLSFLKKKFLIL